jgi:glycosyltransferase involved in cell wall biosynthesis
LIVTSSSDSTVGGAQELSGKPLKILHILNELRFSGAETMLACAGPAFTAAGCESHILATGAAIGPFAPLLARQGYVVHHLPFTKTFSFFAQVRRLIANGGFDVVHIHSERANPIYALLAAPFARVVRTVHNTFMFNRWLRLRKLLERQLCRHLLNVTFIAPSQSVLNNERSRFLLSTHLCPNWYDDAHYRPPTPVERTEARSKLGFAPDTVVTISVGSYMQFKNQDNILKALTKQREVHHLHVGSNADTASGRSLAITAQQLGLSDRLHCAGESEEVRAYLWAADIFVMPSLWEGVGIAAIEAMATGLPAILSNRPGLADFRNLTPEIRYCEPDAAGIAEQIARLTAMPMEERRAIGTCLHLAMQQHFRIESGVRTYLAVYQAT